MELNQVIFRRQRSSPLAIKANETLRSKTPDAVIVSIAAGFDNRFSHLDNGKIRWATFEWGPAER